MDTCGAQDSDRFLQAADLFLTGRQFEKALDLSRERLEQFPGDPAAVMVAFQAWLGLDDLEEAQAAFTALDRVLLRLAGLYRALGEACLRKERDREAIAYFHKGLQLLPDAVAVHHLLRIGTTTVDAVGDEGAEEERAGDERAVSPDFYTITMADLYERQGHLELAAEVLEAIGQKEPHNEEVRRRLANLQAVMNRQTEMPSVVESFPGTQAAVVEELSRWLKNLERLKPHQPFAGEHG